jgi:hypothetical protein
MTATATSIRELDHRRNDGIDATLLWDARTDRLSLAVVDEDSGESLTFGVDPTDALTASGAEHDGVIGWSEVRRVWTELDAVQRRPFEIRTATPAHQTGAASVAAGVSRDSKSRVCPG